MAAGGADRLSLPPLDVAPLRCAPARRTGAIRLQPSARAAHAVCIDRPPPRSAAAVARFSGAVVRGARGTSGGVSLGTDQPARQRAGFCPRYLALRVDGGVKTAS